MSELPSIEGLQQSVCRWKFIAIAAISTFSVVLVAGASLAFIQMQQAATERQRAVEAQHQAEEARKWAEEKLESAVLAEKAAKDEVQRALYQSQIQMALHQLKTRDDTTPASKGLEKR